VLKAAGRDARGQGNASATVTAVMTEQGDGTQVNIATNMTVSGRVAQFGRGVMADVTNKLLQQFVGNLEASVLAPDGKGEAAGAGDAPGLAGAAPATDAAGAASAGSAANTASAAGAGPAVNTANASGGGPAAAAPAAGAQPQRRAEGEPVRVVGLVLSSIAHRIGQFFVRLFHRLTGRRQG
jgi:hypothetical protein